MKRLIVLLLISVFLFGCGSEPDVELEVEDSVKPEMNTCTVDQDCVCGGVVKDTGKCFIGGKNYYEKYVDKDQNCPDFCSGLDGNLVVKCVRGKCMQMYECIMDIDCEKGRCLNNRCV
ncbi:hypothetical protein ACFL0V_03740 [Nanoarchaeota archaeon]